VRCEVRSSRSGRPLAGRTASGQSGAMTDDLVVRKAFGRKDAHASGRTRVRSEKKRTDASRREGRTSGRMLLHREGLRRDRKEKEASRLGRQGSLTARKPLAGKRFAQARTDLFFRLRGLRVLRGNHFQRGKPTVSASEPTGKQAIGRRAIRAGQRRRTGSALRKVAVGREAGGKGALRAGQNFSRHPHAGGDPSQSKRLSVNADLSPKS
jgi:hypothetical protein